MISEVMDFLATPIFAFTPLRIMGGASLLVVGVAIAVLHQALPAFVDPKASLQERQWKAVQVGVGIALSYFLVGLPFLSHPLTALIYASALIFLGMRQANIYLEPQEPCTTPSVEERLVKPHGKDLKFTKDSTTNSNEVHIFIEESTLPQARETHLSPLISDDLKGLHIEIIGDESNFKDQVVSKAKWTRCPMRHEDPLVRLLLAIEGDSQLLPAGEEIYIFHVRSNSKHPLNVAIYFNEEAST